jgi:hypothetical protein
VGCFFSYLKIKKEVGFQGLYWHSRIVSLVVEFRHMPQGAREGPMRRPAMQPEHLASVLGVEIAHVDALDTGMQAAGRTRL